MHQEIRIAGMGGQGVLIIGQLLAHASVAEDQNVVWFPSYGPETRGGLADCTVIISSEEIGSPVSSSPHSLIAMTQPLLDKFAPSVRREGFILVNSSLAEAPEYRSDCHIVEIPANEVAEELGSSRVANMVILGAFVQLVQPVKLETIKNVMKQVIPARNHEFVPLNITAMEKGAELAANMS